LFFPKEIEKYVEEIKTWKKSKNWYLEKGLSWTFGWLLHGEPGTGKTSLVKKVAKLIDFPVVIFDIASMSNNDFINAWNNCKTLIAPCVIIIEDIDSVFRDRKNILGEMGGGLTFDCVLNCISGFEENTGIFVVITTNNIKHIDHAIGIPNTIDNETISSRPGRIDRVIYVGKMEKECRLELANRIFADVDVSRDYIDNIVSKGDGMTAAQFSDICKKECLQIYWDKKTMMQNHKFSELLRKKKVSWNDIDDFISQWHESDSNEPVCSYLGIDESIYASWVENPDSVKNMVI
jgi:SpoVK/Ycf46/Vps4 family AAA+-type ATPase